MSERKWLVRRRRYFGVILRCAAGVCALLPAFSVSVAAQEQQQQQEQRPPGEKSAVDSAAHVEEGGSIKFTELHA